MKEHPDVIVHTAALSNTQYCQQEPEDSFRANVLLPEWIAKGAEKVGAKLLSCSSDQVYAGVTQREMCIRDSFKAALLAREGQIQLPRSCERIVEEHLVEVTDAVE